MSRVARPWLQQEAALGDHRIELVMHFAALAYVGESVDEPLRYYDNNTGGAISLLQAMNSTGVNRFIFSSTCASVTMPWWSQLAGSCDEMKAVSARAPSTALSLQLVHAVLPCVTIQTRTLVPAARREADTIHGFRL